MRRLEERLGELERENRDARERERRRDAEASPLASIGAPFSLASSDGANHIHFTTMIQGDGRAFLGDNTATGSFNNFSLRSARFGFEGTTFRWIDFRIEIDVAGAKLQVQEGWTELHLLPQLRVRVGMFKVPFGLERLQNEGRTAFLERAFPTQLAPNRDLGVEVYGEIAGGAFQYAVAAVNGVVDNSTIDTELDDDKEGVARIFIHPLRPLRRAAVRDLGLGGAVSYGKLRGTVANPELDALRTDGLNSLFGFAAGTTVDDTSLAAGARIRATAQGYYYYWRLGLLGEYVWNSQQVRHGASQAAVTMQAWQAYATFLLTPDRASFDGVRPERPLDLAAGRRGAGGWEMAFRYSGIAIDDLAFAGGIADPAKNPRAARSLSAGLNWYLNSAAKIQVDYVRTDFRGGASGGGNRAAENALMARVQVRL